MKRLVTILILIIVIASVMLITCPDSEKHVDRVSEEISEYVHEDLRSGDDSEMVGNILGNPVVGTISDKVIRFYVKNRLEIEDYALLNVGEMQYNGENHVVSIGMFNHVFCLMKTSQMFGDSKI